MRKKIILFCLSLFLVTIIIHGSARAVTTPIPADSPSPTSASNNLVEELKQRIAAKVSQLKLVERRGIVGTVTDVSNTQITVSDISGNTRFVDVDELTKFSSPSAHENFGISDITRGTTIGILGLYNKESRRILSRFVNVMTTPEVRFETAETIDNKNYNITGLSDMNSTDAIEVESSTLTSSYTKDGGLMRSGFSRIKEGAKFLLTGYIINNDKNHLSASRILLFPDLENNQSSPSAVQK